MAAVDPPDIPHFAVPFNITATGADVDEQGSTEEVFGCVQNIAACAVGFRVDLPSFGIPYPDFANAPINTDAIANALRSWEPRA
jgi:phage baseplate assembly protein W